MRDSTANFKVMACAVAALALAACGSDDSNSGADGSGADAGVLDAADGSAQPTSPFAPCTVSADCRGGELCQAGECREFCDATSPCDGAASICDVPAGVCVFCLQRTDCPEGNLCRDQVCQPGCLFDEDCGAGQLCSELTQSCISGECAVDADCPGGSRCAGARCVEIESCTIGESRCDGGRRFTCSTGIGFDLDSCGEQEACASVGGQARCVNSRCADATNGCIDSARRYECSEDLTSLTIETCDGGLFCVRGDCSEQLCEAGTQSCEDDTTVSECSPDGLDETLRACTDGQVCRNGSCIVAASDSCLTISPEDVEFGSVSVGATAFRTITLQSCGTEEVTVESLVTGGADASAFQPASSVSFPISVPVDGSVTIPMTFNPTRQGVLSATLAAQTNAGVQPAPPISITGQGIDAACEGRYVECARIGASPTFSQSLAADAGDRIQCRVIGMTDSPDGFYTIRRADSAFNRLTQVSAQQTVAFTAEQGPARGETFEVCYNAPGNACDSVCSAVNLRDPVDASRYITVQLTWTSEIDHADGATGSDLDLHMVLDGGCWKSTSTDVHWQADTIDWGTPGATDDAELVRDDSNGFGPEINRILEPASYDVTLGVELYNNNDLGAANYRIEVYHYGRLLDVSEGELPQDKSFVIAGTLRMGGTPTFTPSSTVTATIESATCPVNVD